MYEDELVIAFEDINPQAPVHLVLIPKRHIERISDLVESNALLTSRMITVSNAIAKEKGINESGYRLVMNCGKDAGQEVFHIHMHVLGGRKMVWPPG